MTLQTKAMQYEDVKNIRVSKGVGKKVALNQLDNYASNTMIWHLVKRHKFGLVVVTLIVYIAFNSFGTLIVGLFESLK